VPDQGVSVTLLSRGEWLSCGKDSVNENTVLDRGQRKNLAVLLHRAAKPRLVDRHLGADLVVFDEMLRKPTLGQLPKREVPTVELSLRINQFGSVVRDGLSDHDLGHTQANASHARSG
jgi:hypothetical protein